MTLSPAQAAFLSLHVQRRVEKWTWYFCGAQLRAYAGKRSATIAGSELDGLFEAGLMFKGAGVADVHATEAGRAAVGEMGK